MTREEVENEIQSAFSYWETCTDFVFIKTRDSADIEIQFGGENHGDNPFKGALAHAYHPVIYD